MIVETPLAYGFILQDDIYLLNRDKQSLKQSAIPVPTAPPLVETPKPVYKYLGENKKKLLILVHYGSEEHIDPLHRAALERTLKRIGYEPGDIALLNLSKHGDSLFEELTSFFSPEKLLILGNNALPKGLTPPAFNKAGNANGKPVLLTFAFDDLMNSNENKKAFWEQVKQF
jgi:hypothetical protein